MPLNQYVYFALPSERATAKEMAAVLGIEPDETTVRASRLAEPPMPVCHHRWKIVCRAPGMRVDEQVAQILDRLRPHVGRIADLARQLEQEGGSSSAVLQVVRYFSDDECAGNAERSGPNIFGWRLGRDVLEFLDDTGAVLDVDEYDLAPDAP